MTNLVGFLFQYQELFNRLAEQSKSRGQHPLSGFCGGPSPAEGGHQIKRVDKGTKAVHPFADMAYGAPSEAEGGYAHVTETKSASPVGHVLAGWVGGPSTDGMHPDNPVPQNAGDPWSALKRTAGLQSGQLEAIMRVLGFDPDDEDADEEERERVESMLKELLSVKSKGLDALALILK